MAQYIMFPTATGGTVLVETDDEEVTPAAGVEKAGLLDSRPAKAVATAGAIFEDAVGSAVQKNVDALDGALRRLAKPPKQIELTFGLKATGEVGNFAIAKVGGEASISVKLVWTHE